MLVIEEFKFESPKTKDLYKILGAFNLNNKKTLILTNGKDENIYMSGRNIPKLQVLEAQKASTYDILNNQMIILCKNVITEIEKTLVNK